MEDENDFVHVATCMCLTVPSLQKPLLHKHSKRLGRRHSVVVFLLFLFRLMYSVLGLRQVFVHEKHEIHVAWRVVGKTGVDSDKLENELNCNAPPVAPMRAWSLGTP